MILALLIVAGIACLLVSALALPARERPGRHARRPGTRRTPHTRPQRHHARKATA